jgi:mono/diheme cytochrome c family protein
MPGFAGVLSNAQMANAITYVRTNFGNNYPKPVTEADVAKLAHIPHPEAH